MRLGLILFKYFPYGGLQRDMLAIAKKACSRGHDVTIVTGEWQGDKAEGIHTVILPAQGLSNHKRNQSFALLAHGYCQSNHFDCIIGFNKMPGLDFYYAADTSFIAKGHKERNWFYRLLPRYRHYAKFEEAVFGAQLSTELLMISQQSLDEYEEFFPGCSQRATLLPPGINRDRQMPADYSQQRQQFRQQQKIDDNEKLILMVGSGFKTKGVDRAIKAVAALSGDIRWRLMIVGDDRTKPFQQLAASLGVAEQVVFVGPSDQVKDYLWAADVLIHPAYRENTGTVILEAMAAGLPVIASSVCGYAYYITDWNMGAVLGQPFSQKVLDLRLEALLKTNEAERYREQSKKFVAQADIFSLTDRTLETVEAWHDAVSS
jgi:UDP-glucose:(heptosyl)LPS alpha-1,3-glucosyltransferase